MEVTRYRLIHPPASPSSGPSLLLAVAMTAALFFAAFVAGTAVPRSWWDRGQPMPAAERITYVGPVALPAPPVVAAPPRVGAPSAAAPAVPFGARPAASAPATTAPRVGPGFAPGAAAPDTGAGRRGTSAPGAAGPAGADVRGPTLGPLQVGAGRSAAPPLTGTQQDSALRATMRSIFNPATMAASVGMAKDAAARRTDEQNRELGRTAGGGAPTLHGLKLGFSVKFGGPSAADRKRDAQIDSTVRARLGAIDERRKREIADSIRRAERIIP